MNLYLKRLERGRFVWPQADSGSVCLSAAQLSMLLEGIDWRAPAAHLAAGARGVDFLQSQLHTWTRVRYTACSCHQHRLHYPMMSKTLKRLVLGRDETIAKLLAEIARLKRWRFGRSAERMDASPPAAAALRSMICSACPRLAAPRPSRPAARGIDAHAPEQAADDDCAGCRGPCPRTCRARPSCTRLRAAPVPTAGRRCASSARTSPSCSISSPATFKVLRHVRPKLSCAHCSRVIQLPAPVAADRARAAGRGAAGAGDRGQVRRPLPAVSPAGHLPARWRGAGPRHPGRLGGRGLVAARAPGRCPGPLCARGRARCTPTTPRCRCSIRGEARPRPDDCGPTCAMIGRRAAAIPPAVWYRYSPDRKAAASAVRTCEHFRGILQADAYSGLRCVVPERAHPRGLVLGARATQVLRPLRSEPLADCRRGDPAHRRALRDRARDSRAAAQRACSGETRTQPARCSTQLHAWLSATLRTVSAKSQLAGGDPLCAGALARADPLSRRWAHRDRQQQRRARHSSRSCWVGATTCSPVRMPAASVRPTSTA